MNFSEFCKNLNNRYVIAECMAEKIEVIANMWKKDFLFDDNFSKIHGFSAKVLHMKNLADDISETLKEIAKSNFLPSLDYTLALLISTKLSLDLEYLKNRKCLPDNMNSRKFYKNAILSLYNLLSPLNDFSSVMEKIKRDDFGNDWKNIISFGDDDIFPSN